MVVKISKQLRWQRKNRAEGKCPVCAKPAVVYYCLEHMVKIRERLRKRRGSVERLVGTKTYQLEAEAGVFNY